MEKEVSRSTTILREKIKIHGNFFRKQDLDFRTLLNLQPAINNIVLKNNKCQNLMGQIRLLCFSETNYCFVAPNLSIKYLVNQTTRVKIPFLDWENMDLENKYLVNPQEYQTMLVIFEDYLDRSMADFFLDTYLPGSFYERTPFFCKMLKFLILVKNQLTTA